MNKSRFLEFVQKIPQEQVSPKRRQLQEWAQPQSIKNEFGNPLFHSKISARSAKFTSLLNEENQKVIDKVYGMIKPEDFIVMNLFVGQNPKIRMKATIAVYKKNPNIPLMNDINFFTSDKLHENPDIMTLYVPQYPEVKVILDPIERITYVLGIDYYGEAKMSILRMAMEIMRTEQQGLGLHAGSKYFKLKESDGKLNEKGMLIFGLSGTGKTTLTCHDHNLKDPEKVVILQDDITLLDKEGNGFGTEKGFYVKCDSFPEHEQLTTATTKPGNVMENVYADPSTGKVDWKNFSIAANTRAIISRESVRGTGETIDLPSVDFVLYNTRRPELPPIGRLRDANQSAAYYALGESIITSAEDPTRVGEPKRVVGFDPFIISDKHVNINRIAEIFGKKPDIQSFVVNTGYVGDESNNISVEDTIEFIEAAIRGNIVWEMDEELGYEIPIKVNNKSLDKFLPRNYFGKEKYSELVENLTKDRLEYLHNIGGINQSIIDALR